MSTNLPAARPATSVPTPIPAARSSALSLLRSWSLAEPLPDEAAALVPAALADAEAGLIPVGIEGVAVLVDGFCALVPVPMRPDPEDRRRQVVDSAFVRALMERLESKPAVVVRKALDRVVDSHKWETPVKIAQVMEAVDHEMGRVMEGVQRLRSAALRLRLDGKAGGGAPAPARLYRDKSPEEREAFDRLMAQFRGLGEAAEVPLYDDERMAERDKERIRARSLAKVEERHDD